MNVAYGMQTSEGRQSNRGFNGAGAAVDGSWNAKYRNTGYETCTQTSNSDKPWYDLYSHIVLDHLPWIRPCRL